MDKAIEKLNKSLGKNVAFSGTDTKKKVDSFSSGIIALDYITGIGGLPKGRIVDVTGLYSTGKTTLCLQAIANAQKQGIKCAFIDAEFTFIRGHAESLGVNMDGLVIVQPDCGEEAFEALEILIKEGYGLIVVDSTSALVPKAEIEAEAGTPPMARQARLISQGMRKTINLISKNQTCVIFISQMRQNIMGGTRSPYTTTGGMALGFYTSLKIQLNKAGIITNKTTGESGALIKLRTHKNKLAEQKDEIELIFYKNKGFDAEYGYFDVAEKIGVIARSGNSYFFGDEKLGVGVEKSKVYLDSNPDLKQQILAQLLSGEPQLSPELELSQQD